MLRVDVLKVGEGIIADGKKVLTSVLADAVDDVIGVTFKGQQHRSTSGMDQFNGRGGEISDHEGRGYRVRV